MSNETKSKLAKAEGLRSLAKTARLQGDDELAKFALICLAKETGNRDTHADLSYSHIMRQLRKGDKDIMRQFQKAFKDAFDAAAGAGEEDLEAIALMEAMQKVDIKKKAQIHRLYKIAQYNMSLQRPDLSGRIIADIVKFLLQRMNPEDRGKALANVKNKILKLNAAEIANKNSPGSASIGSAITFIKTVLNGYPSGYVQQVISHILIYLGV